jgi:hypothetical protein
MPRPSNVAHHARTLAQASHLERLDVNDVDGRDKPGHDDGGSGFRPQ